MKRPDWALILLIIRLTQHPEDVAPLLPTRLILEEPRLIVLPRLKKLESRRKGGERACGQRELHGDPIVGEALRPTLASISGFAKYGM